MACKQNISVPLLIVITLWLNVMSYNTLMVAGARHLMDTPKQLPLPSAKFPFFLPPPLPEFPFFLPPPLPMLPPLPMPPPLPKIPSWLPPPLPPFDFNDGPLPTPWFGYAHNASKYSNHSISLIHNSLNFHEPKGLAF